MFVSTIPIQMKIIVVRLGSILASLVLLQACSQTLVTDSPPLEPQPVPATATDTSNQLIPPSDKYLFMEIMIAFDGTGTLPMMFVDFPGYEYDSSTGTLKSHGRGEEISLSSSDWGFLGIGQNRNGAMGGGVASQLTTVDQLPFTVPVPVFAGKLGEYSEEINHVPFTLLTISTDGAVLIDIDGQQLMLQMGEKLEQMQEMDVNTERFDGHLQATFSVINHGWNARELIDSK